MAEARLPDDRAADRYPHLTICSSCAAEYAWLTRVIELICTDQSEEPPPDTGGVIEHLFRAYRVSKPASTRPRSFVVLSFDSAELPVSNGLRGWPQLERQLLFSAGGLELDVRVVPAGILWLVMGQVLGQDAGGEVLLRGASDTLQTTLNEFSEFRLPPVRAGIYRLTLRLSDTDLEITALEVGAAHESS